MEYRHNFRLFQPGNQLAAIVVIAQLDVEHVSVVDTVCRNSRQFNTSGFCQRLQRVVVGLPQGEALQIDSLCRFQLRPEIRGLQIRHQVA
ncbi:Uncharacterised protein [Klebsiella pneumoniae]|nr:Uncharacterised protein [Klebsiella pneumoniae]